MDDLAELLSGDRQYLMLGGGNPGKVPAVIERYRACLAKTTQDDDTFYHQVGLYGEPGGAGGLINALVELFNARYDWNLEPDNIVLTNGSQNAFFLLFNLFAGPADGHQRKIILPLAPEYIGYEDVAIHEKFFVATRPVIDILRDDRLRHDMAGEDVPGEDGPGRKRFKYRVDFESLQIPVDAGAICVSRPTNPTGNVITDEELQRLDTLATDNGIPLIIDNAYGEPFPDIIHRDVNLFWHDNIVLCMSLSKLGLPAVRTGIIVAAPDVTQRIRRMNSVINLTPGSLGPVMTTPLFASGEILTLSRDHIKPFYAAKAEKALACFDHHLSGLPAYAHVAEGAIFLWLWFKGLPINSQTLYERLKDRGVIVVPGHYFFPGLDDSWRHCHECIRVSYAMDDDQVQRGIEVIAEEVKKAYKTQ